MSQQPLAAPAWLRILEQQQAPPSGLTILRRRAVRAKTGLPPASMYDLISKGEFPPPIV
jgi:predicted DNA-binding transcriptional regulator AlpA